MQYIVLKFLFIIFEKKQNNDANNRNIKENGG